MPHFPLRPLVRATSAPWGVASKAMLAMDPASRRACVFVHGWTGDALETWQGFPGLIRDSVRAEGTDFFFWGYESVKPTAMFSAALLREFLEALLDLPVRSVINPSLFGARTRDEGFRYEQLVICAHSMGAVVSRRAILDIETATPGRIDGLKLRMLLFAPAHRGTDLVKLSQEMMGGSIFGIPLGALRAGALVKLKSLRDLETGSPTLADLEKDNEAARGRLSTMSRSDASLKARVLHAEKDDVVRQENFDADPGFIPVLGHRHQSICKPSDTYPRPMQELEALL